MGVRPDLTGQGHGLTYVNAILDSARRAFGPAAFRVTVAEFNKRALRVWEKAGFHEVHSFQRERETADPSWCWWEGPLPNPPPWKRITRATEHGGGDSDFPPRFVYEPVLCTGGIEGGKPLVG